MSGDGRCAARTTRQARVQLRELRGARAAGSPAAADPRVVRRGAGRAAIRVRPTLYARGVGRPRSRQRSCCGRCCLQAFYSVALRSAADGAAGLQPAVPLVRRLCRWTRRCGTRAPSARTATACWTGDVAQRLLAAVVAQPRIKALMSHEHFSVDGTLIQAWASAQVVPAQAGLRSRAALAATAPRPPSRAATASATGAARSAATRRHASTTDPDARLARKSDGQASIMAYAGHVLMENRSGLVAAELPDPCHRHGRARRSACADGPDRRPARRITLGADKGYDVAGFIAALRVAPVTPHVAVGWARFQAGRAARLGRGRPHACATRATRPASARANGSRRCSAGSRARPGCAKPSTAAANASAGTSTGGTAYNLVRLRQAARRGSGMTANAASQALPASPAASATHRAQPPNLAPNAKAEAICSAPTVVQQPASALHSKPGCINNCLEDPQDATRFKGRTNAPAPIHVWIEGPLVMAAAEIPAAR